MGEAPAVPADALAGYREQDGIYFGAGFDGSFNYSDGDETERALMEAVAGCRDRSLFSPELAVKIGDWPSRYHLSAKRANLLRPFADLLRGDVLEIGAGCGAISRFLGENGGRVVALEGSPRRAKIAQLRTADLTNVRVVCERAEKFAPEARFDVVTLIGVLEYARVYLDNGADAQAALLSHLTGLLKPNGILIVAIENQLGLKYFAGAREDHTGLPFSGVNGGYTDSSVATFGKTELSEILASAGLQQQRWYIPCPDYKLPNTVLSPEALKGQQELSTTLLAQSAKADTQQPSEPLFSLERYWSLLYRNGLIEHLANSFLVVAGAIDTALAPLKGDPSFAWHYSVDRHPAFTKQTRFLQGRNEVAVIRNPLTSAPAPDVPLRCLPVDEKLLEGRNWWLELVAIVNRPDWSVSQVSAWARVWLNALAELCKIARLDSSTFASVVDGHLFDAAPFNLVVDRQGRAQFFDQEWHLTPPIEFGYVVFRGLKDSLLRITSFAAPRESVPININQLILAVLSDLGVLITKIELDRYALMEVQVQAWAFGKRDNSSPEAAITRSWADTLKIRTPVEREAHQRESADWSARYASATQQIEVLRAESARKDARFGELNTQIERARHRAGEFEQLANERLDTIERTEERAMNATRMAERVQSALSASRVEAQSLSEKADAIRKDLERIDVERQQAFARVAELSADKSGLEEVVQRGAAEIAALRAELSSYRGSLEVLNRELEHERTKLKQQTELAARQLAELEARDERIQALNRELETSRNWLRESQAQSQSLAGDLDEALKALAAEKMRHEQAATDDAARLAKLEAELAAERETTLQQKGRIENLDLIERAYDELSRATEKLREELYASEIALTAERERTLEVELQNAALQEELRQLQELAQRENASLMQDLEYARNLAQSETATLQEELDRVRSAAQTENATLMDELERVRAFAQAEAAALQEELAHMRAQAQNESAALQEELDRVRTLAANENVALGEEFERLKSLSQSENAALQAELDRVQALAHTESATLQAELDRVQALSQSENASLQAELDRVQSISRVESDVLKDELERVRLVSQTETAALQEELERVKALSQKESADMQQELLRVQVISQTETSALKEELERVRTHSSSENAALAAELERVRLNSQDEALALQEELDRVRAQSQVETSVLQEELDRVRSTSRSETVNLQDELARLKSILTDVNQEFDERLRKSSATIAALRREKERTGRDIETLQSELDAERGARSSERQTAASEIDNLRASLSKRESDFTRETGRSSAAMRALRVEAEKLRQRALRQRGETEAGRRGLLGSYRATVARLGLGNAGASAQERKAIEQSQLFDAEWYRKRYPDVAAAGKDPLQHYLEHGASEQREPHPLLDSAWYLMTYPQVAESGMTPLGHYAAIGAREGADPSPVFDTDFYIRSNPDLAADGLNPLFHFTVQGGREGRDPHPAFDASWYLERNRDVVAAGVNPLVHYMVDGWREGRDPHKLFDTSWYIENYPDVLESGFDPLTHYLRYGVREGLNPSPAFDTRYYAQTNPDVATSGMHPFAHYILVGAIELRAAVPLPEPKRVVPSIGSVIKAVEPAKPASSPIRFGKHEAEAALNRPAQALAGTGCDFVSEFMYFVWRNRPDLQASHDLTTLPGQENFAIWYVFEGTRDYELTESGYSPELCAFLRSADPTAPEYEPWFSRFLRLAWQRDEDLRSRFSLDTPQDRLGFAAWYAIAHRNSYLARFFALDEILSRLGDRIIGDITLIMFAIWRHRPDLQSAFDLRTKDGQAGFVNWFQHSAAAEYDLNGLWPVASIAAVHSEPVAAFAAEPYETSSELLAEGANLLGFARGGFGMGEHLRMTARSLVTQDVPFSLIDFRSAASSREIDDSAAQWIDNSAKFQCNILNVNADVFPALALGRHQNLLKGRTNIAYWAWELPHCPPEWEIPLQMVDEVWTNSEFVRQAFLERAKVPVINMPLAASLPPIRPGYSKSSFGLAEDTFCFLFSFDGASWVERKNPIAVARAFKLAFADLAWGGVSLVIKTMNSNKDDPRWTAFMDEIAGDDRIVLLERHMSRDDYLGLCSVCDSYVSLHRSEGFGYGPIENMLMGKPVIVTDYSGVKEYATPETACLVNYSLIPVREGDYPSWRGQEWADPDVEHAAWHMKRLFSDHAYAQTLGATGKAFAEANFNERVIGARYRTRLEEIGVISERSIARPLRSVETTNGKKPLKDPVPAGLPGAQIQVDMPNLQNRPILLSGTAIMEGWAIARSGACRLTLWHSGKQVAEANYGFQRPDVGQAHPTLKNSGLSGFLIRFDTEQLQDGPAALRLILEAEGGEQYFLDFEATIDNAFSNYEKWRQRNLQNYPEFDRISLALSALPSLPTFELLMPVEPGRAQKALETLASLREQSYAGWHVTVFGSKQGLASLRRSTEGFFAPESLEFVEGAPLKDIVSGSKSDYIGMVEPGDIVLPHAMLALAGAVTEQECDILYSDEERLKPNGKAVPFFKPQWSPLWLKQRNYIGRLWVARKSLLDEAITDQTIYGENFEHSLLLQLTNATSAVGHIASVLCTRPLDKLPKPLPLSAPGARVAEPAGSPLVTIVMLTRFGRLDLVEKCFDSISNLTTYRNFEVIVIANNVSNTDELVEFQSKWPYQFYYVDQPFNWAALNNIGAEKGQGSVFLFLNDDIEVLEPHWLQHMLNLLDEPGVGVVGAKLVYPNGLIQHTGISLVNYGGGSRHPLRFCSPSEDGALRYANEDREWSAVTGACLMVKRDLYEQLGGIDAAFPIIANDTDFCLRVREAGYRNAISEKARLIHYEGVSRAGIPEHEDVDLFWRRWGHILNVPDPYMNPNFDMNRDDMVVNPEVEISLKPRISLSDYEALMRQRPVSDGAQDG